MGAGSTKPLPQWGLGSGGHGIGVGSDLGYTWEESAWHGWGGRLGKGNPGWSSLLGWQNREPPGS